MTGNSKASGASPQNQLGSFTVLPMALHNFYFMKIMNVLYRLCPSKVWDLQTALDNKNKFLCLFRFRDHKYILMVAPRVKKTEVFRKGWNFANRIYFASWIMRKHYFLLWTKEIAFFPYFYHWIIFYNAELFDCTVNFKFYLNIFIF